MIVKITSKRQVTLPTQVLDALGVGPGDQLDLEESPDGFILRPRRIDYSKLGTFSETRFHPGQSSRSTLRSLGVSPMIRRYGIDTSYHSCVDPEVLKLDRQECRLSQCPPRRLKPTVGRFPMPTASRQR